MKQSYKVCIFNLGASVYINESLEKPVSGTAIGEFKPKGGKIASAPSTVKSVI
jgi:hypothetical protein